MNETNEIEVFYRGLAMLGMLMQGCDYENVPDLAKDLASRMMEDLPKSGIVAVKPRRQTRK